MIRSVKQNHRQSYEANMSASSIFDLPNIVLYIVKRHVPFANHILQTPNIMYFSNHHDTFHMLSFGLI